MRLERIINSLLETDAYKFSMGQAIYHQFSDYKTTWTFKCRNKDVFFGNSHTLGYCGVLAEMFLSKVIRTFPKVKTKGVRS